MEDITLLIVLLAIFWSLAYWIIGGIFFAIVTLLHMGRVRKARFGCLFSLTAIVCGVGASWSGVLQGQEAMRPCLMTAETGTEIIAAVFGCGFGGVVGMFVIWAAALVLCGFLLFYLSRPQKDPWIDLSDSERAKRTEGESFFD